MSERWTASTIGDAATVIAGQSPDGSAYNESGKGMPFYQGKKEFDEKFIGEPTTWTTQVKRVAQARDILMSVRAPVGPVNFATQECCIGRGLAAIRSGPRLNRDFLFYYLLHKRGEIEGTEGAVFACINKDQIEAIELPLPPLAEQQRIVGILDEALAAIATAKANTEKNLTNARAVFDSGVDAEFERLRTRVQGRSLADWVEDVSTGPFGSLLHKSDYVEGGIPLVNPINIEGEKIVPDPRKAVDRKTANRLKRYILKAGDIVTARRGEIGRCAVIGPDQAGWLCGTGSFFIRPGKTIDPHFLTHLLRSSPYRSQLERASARATMPSISNDDLNGLVIHVPTMAEQRAVEVKFRAVAEQTQRLESLAQQRLAALDALQKSLLHQAFTGQLGADAADRTPPIRVSVC